MSRGGDQMTENWITFYCTYFLLLKLFELDPFTLIHIWFIPSPCLPWYLTRRPNKHTISGTTWLTLWPYLPSAHLLLKQNHPCLGTLGSDGRLQCLWCGYLLLVFSNQRRCVHEPQAGEPGPKKPKRTSVSKISYVSLSLNSDRLQRFSIFFSNQHFRCCAELLIVDTLWS